MCRFLLQLALVLVLAAVLLAGLADVMKGDWAGRVLQALAANLAAVAVSVALIAPVTLIFGRLYHRPAWLYGAVFLLWLVVLLPVCILLALSLVGR